VAHRPADGLDRRTSIHGILGEGGPEGFQTAEFRIECDVRDNTSAFGNLS
jgi:hypothetical protein